MRKSGRRGNCYVTSEALYHLLGGRKAGWLPKRMQYAGDCHWFLYNARTDVILDATAKQFKRLPDYTKARGSGFLTKRPSKRAKLLMQTLLYQ